MITLATSPKNRLLLSYCLIMSFHSRKLCIRTQIRHKCAHKTCGEKKMQFVGEKRYGKLGREEMGGNLGGILTNQGFACIFRGLKELKDVQTVKVRDVS